MKISDVRVRIVKTDKSKIKASASITIDDCFVVHDIKVIAGQTGINDLNAGNDGDKAVYDLNGRRMEAPLKGICIVDGVKTIVK